MTQTGFWKTGRQSDFSVVFDVRKDRNLPNPAHIVDTDTLVTLLGGGEHDPADLVLALSRAPVLVAADGGADRALAAGYAPVAVIGDLDSISEVAHRDLPPDIIHHIPEQSSTDFEKALQRISVPGMIAVGVTGYRMDHELAA